MKPFDISIRKIFRRKRECCNKIRNVRRKRRQQILIAVVVWFLLLVWVTSRLPKEYSVIQRKDIDYQGRWNQSDLDHFAQNIQLNYSVVENNYNNGMLYRSEVVLTNNGVKTFPWRNWSIIFCQPYLVEPEHHPYPKGLDKPKWGVRLFNLHGGVYMIQALPNSLEGITPGERRSIEYISQYHNIAKTDIYPNWYIAVDGLEPRIIENTRGESYDWVGHHNTPNLWKRVSDPDDERFDYFNPFTAEERFDTNGVADLKGAPLPVIPVPAYVDEYDPSVTINALSGNWVIVTSTLLAGEANYLSDVWGLRVVAQYPSQEYISFVEEEIRVTALGKALPTDESYELRVSPETKVITIKSSRPAGAFYAVQTLMSLADALGNISKTVIQDAPRYEYRGIMLDVARNFQNKEKIFRYIDVMAMYKLNKLHFHLSDDEGWRLAIPGLPELTQVGASRCHDLSETKCLLPYLGSGPFIGSPGSGFYTMEDYRAILRYAALHHIEVIPEIDMPGHSHAAIRAMEARRTRLGINVTEASRFLLQDLQDTSEYKSVQGFVKNAINPCLQSTYTFISRIINTLFAMHRDINPLKVFHFGGDELSKGAWKKSPVCQRLRESGVNISLADYLAIQVSNMTALYNLDLAGWEDGLISSKKIPINRDKLKNENVYAYAWNNVWEWGTARRAYDLANSGYKVVITPATNLYFDHPQEPEPEERGLYWASRYTDTFQAYSVFPENLYWNAQTTKNGGKIKICQENDCPELVKRENIAGMQGTLFGELLRTQSITDYMLLPRIMALADRAWHQTTWEFESDQVKRSKDLKTDWTSFANTLGYKELRRLDKMGYKYRIPPPGAKLDGNKLRVSLTFPGLPVEISHDGGKTWTEIDVSPTTITVPEGNNCMLRSRAAFGSRYSRAVSLQRGDDNNAAGIPSKLSTFLVFTMMALKLCAFTFT